MALTIAATKSSGATAGIYRSLLAAIFGQRIFATIPRCGGGMEVISNGRFSKRGKHGLLCLGCRDFKPSERALEVSFTHIHASTNSPKSLGRFRRHSTSLP